MNVKWSPEINLGAVLQSGVVVASAISAVIAGTIYISNIRETISVVQVRVDALERVNRDKLTDDKNFQAETRSSLDRVRQMLGDLRVDMVTGRTTTTPPARP